MKKPAEYCIADVQHMKISPMQMYVIMASINTNLTQQHNPYQGGFITNFMMRKLVNPAQALIYSHDTIQQTKRPSHINKIGTILSVKFFHGKGLAKK